MRITPEELSQFFQDKDLLVLMESLLEGEDIGNDNEQHIVDALRDGVRESVKEGEKPLFTTKETYRYSTRESYIKELIGLLREKIEGSIITDATCGIGKAVISLSKVSKQVVGIEIDPIRAILAEQNIRLQNISNATIINDDAKSKNSATILSDSDVIFVDPERTQNSRKRNIKENKPELDYFTSKFPQKKIIYEISPMIPYDEIPLEASIVFYSYHNRHARTILLYNFYNERKIIALNHKGEKIIGNKNIEYQYDNNMEEDYTGKHIVDIDETIRRAGLLYKLKEYGVTSIFNDGKILYTIIEENKDIPFSNTSRIICDTNDKETIRREAANNNIGRIIIRYHIDPSMYAKEANSIAGNGENKAYLYRIGEKYLLCL